jgi:NADH dehydrogenase (ubiquinone) 1 alpha subcomplex subunit 5
VGLEVVPKAPHKLMELYGQILTALKHLPEEAEYRKVTELITKNRLEIVQHHQDVSTIEQKIDCGQIEELISQAEDELSLISKMEEWKPWEDLAYPPPPSQL